MAGIGRLNNKSGRKKGTPNKKSLAIADKALEAGVDPFEILLLFANNDWEGLGYQAASKTKYTSSGERYEVDIITPDQRLKAASDACQYLYPKRKAIQLTEDKNLSDDPGKDYSDEELDRM